MEGAEVDDRTNGIYDNPKNPGREISTRLGFLFGRRFGEKWGFETGYFHDFKGGWSQEGF